MRIYCIVVILNIGFLGQAFGATWHVEKDGSGDFQVIQNAVTMASDGDVIEIGTGRYDEFNEYNTITDVFVLIENKSLTFRGAGPENTIIGPESTHNRSAAGFIALDMDFIRFENLSVENMVNGSSIYASSRILEVENCIFKGGDSITSSLPNGVAVSCTEGGYIRNCEFYKLDLGTVVYSAANSLVIEDCFFSGFGVGVSVNWSDSFCTIRNCELIGEGQLNSAGIVSSVWAHTTIEACTISECSQFAIAIADSGPVVVRDCHINQFGGGGILLITDHAAQIKDNVIVSDMVCIGIRGNGTPGATTISNNHLLRDGSGWYVKDWWGNYWPPMENLNMEGNYWGTDDLEEIAAWIEDVNDNPEYQYLVDFEPIADGIVSSQSMTLGGMKALFR